MAVPPPDTGRGTGRWSRRRRWVVATVGIVAVLAAVGVVAGGGGDDLPAPSRSFCAAAREYDDKISSGKLSLDRQIELITRMAEHAPRDVRREARMFLDAWVRFDEGDRSQVDDRDLQAAVEAVNRRAANGCGIYERERGGI